MSIDWVYLTDGDKEQALNYSTQVNKDKLKYKSTNLLNKDSHYIGKLGEIIYAKAKELIVNFETNKFEGDGGADFVDTSEIDVKTTVYYKYPILKEYSNKVNTNIMYALVALDLGRSRGYLVGEISGEQLKQQYVKDFKGLGPRCIASKKTLIR